MTTTTNKRLRAETTPHPQLLAAAAWVGWAKTALEDIQHTAARLREESEDPASPLYGQVEFQGEVNVSDHGISPLCDISFPGLVGTPNPLAFLTEEGGEG